MSEIEQFLSELKQEGEVVETLIPDTAEKKDTSPDSTPEIKPEEVKPPQGGDNTPDVKDEPFHKNPRFKRLVEEKNQLHSEVETLKTQLQELGTKVNNPIQANSQVPDWFVELFGNSPEAWSKYQTKQTEERNTIKQEVMRELESRATEQRQNQEKWNNWVGQQVESLKDEGLSFDNNELMKVMVDYRPTDDEGNLDFKKGFAILSKIKPSDNSVDAKKKIAGATSSGASGEAVPNAKKMMNQKDLKKGFLDLARSS